jgi:hypothetical protein
MMVVNEMKKIWGLALLLFAVHLQAQLVTVTPNLVQQRYSKMSNAGTHPRLFFSMADMERIKRGIASGDPVYQLGARQMQKEADAVLETPLLEYYLDDARLRVPSVHKFAVQIPSLVINYHLTGDERYAKRVWQQLEKMGTYPDWGQNRHFLDAGIGAFNLALAYDGLYHYWNEAQRRFILDLAQKQVLNDGVAQMNANSWWHTIKNNWNGICNGGIIMLSLALYENNPSYYSAAIAKAASQIPRYLSTFEPDGQSEEGLMYWSYGINYTLLCFETLNRGLGTNFGMADMPGMRKTGWFPVLMSGPVVGLSIGDDPLKEGKSRSFLWFSGYHRDTALAAISRSLLLETKSMAWHDLIHYDAGMATAQSGSVKAPTKQYVRGIEYMSLRSSWENDAWFVGMHGGHNNASHGHLDAGSFDIQAMGENWALGSLGRDDYTFPGYFTKETYPRYLDLPSKQDTAGRWHFFRMRAESKNVVVASPDSRPDQDPMGEARQVPTPQGINKWVLDLQPCYHRDFSYYHRAIALKQDKQGNKVISIYDTIRANENKPIWWSMFAPAHIAINNNNRQAILTINGKKMVAEIIQPNSAFFQLTEAGYLPGQSFPLTRNSPNKGISRLAIFLRNADEVIFQVNFRAYDSLAEN